MSETKKDVSTHIFTWGRQLQQRNNPKGNFTINVNATKFLKPHNGKFKERFPSIGVSCISISQSIDAPITNKDTITMSGNFSLQNDHRHKSSNLINLIRLGGFNVSGRHMISKGCLELDVRTGSGPGVGLRGSRKLTDTVSCNGGVTLNFRKNAFVLGLNGTFSMQWNKYTVSSLSYNAGLLQWSMTVALNHCTEKQEFNVNCSLGTPNCYVSASYMRNLAEYEMKIRLAAKIGTFGYMVEYSAEKKVSKHSTVVASVLIESPNGVTLRLKLKRSSQSYVIPIQLSKDIIPVTVIYATVTPLLIWFVVKKVIIEPMNAEHQKRELDRTEENHKKRMVEKKRNAEAAIKLMMVQYERIRRDEKKRKGLIIEKAVYGKLESDRSTEDAPSSTITTAEQKHSIDVTIPLQYLASNSILKLHDSNKSELPGFYDPCVGAEKSLQIDYIFSGINHRIVIKDNEPLRIPTANVATNDTNPEKGEAMNDSCVDVVSTLNDDSSIVSESKADAAVDAGSM